MIDYKEQAGIAMNPRCQLADPTMDPKVTLGALAFADELGRLLCRMKAGQDINRATVKRATLLLSKKIRESAKFNRPRSSVELIERFAGRVIVEWIVDRCGECTGRGKRAMSVAAVVAPQACPVCRGEGRVCTDEMHLPSVPFECRPQVIREYARCGHCNGRRLIYPKSDNRSAVRTDLCPTCGGSGRAPVDHAARAKALGVTVEVYRRNWEGYFQGALAMLDHEDAGATEVMVRQMRRV